jgi:hypothetical protein
LMTDAYTSMHKLTYMQMFFKIPSQVRTSIRYVHPFPHCS